MSDHKLSAQARTQFGKGAARKLRRAGQVPAVMYGHGSDPLHIALPAHDAMMALKQANALLTITLDQDEHLALARDVQRDPIKPVIEHIDLVIVRKGEKVVVAIPVHLEGEVRGSAVVTVEMPEIEIEVEATSIPESFVISIEGLEPGTLIHASEIELPKGATLVADPEALVVNIAEPISEEAFESELAEGEAAPAESASTAEAAEGEEA